MKVILLLQKTHWHVSKHFCEEDYTASEDGKGKKIVLKKGAVPTIFKWSSEKRSQSTFVSKGKCKGEALEAPQKKRQRKSCPHCERKQAAIDRLQNDFEEKICTVERTK